MARRWLSSETLRERIARFLWERGGLIGLATLVLYVAVAPAHIVDGDNAEFATLGTTGGTAHPSGYPLYLLWLRAMQWLPGSSPAHTAAIATATLGALAAFTLHAAARAWGARPFGATIAVAVFAGAPVVLRISTEAEVFALNNLVVAMVLWLAARGGPLYGARRTIALAFVAGLGLANHMTCTLVAPVGLLGAVRGVRESARPGLTVVLSIGALAVGLLPYVYLLLTPDTPLSWGKVRDLGDLLHVVLRKDYGGPASFLPTGESPTVTEHLVALAAMHARTWLVVGPVAALATFGWRIARRDEAGETRTAWAMLAMCWVLAGPLLVSQFNIAPTGLGLYVCQRFHMLAALLFVVPVAVAASTLDVLVARTRLGVPRACVLAATLGFVAVASTSLPHLARVHTPAVEHYARNVLVTLPRDAVVFAGGDDEYLGMGYVQWALGERRDVAVVAPQLTVYAWYEQRIARRGVVVPPGEGIPIVRLIDDLLVRGRPVFVEKSRAEVISAFPTYPYGTLMRVMPRGTHVPSIEHVVAENEAIFARFRLDYARPGGDDEFATVVHRRYAATWSLLGRKAEQNGKRDLALRAHAIAAEIGPTP